jgi:hypothetical protein
VVCLQHLYYNTTSLFAKGMLLERSVGTERFLTIVFALLVLDAVLFVGMAYALTELLLLCDTYQGCTVGFSGVLFGISALMRSEGYRHRIFVGDTVRIPLLGIRVDIEHAVWYELVLASVLQYNVSFVGHLSGIVAGLLIAHGEMPLALAVTTALQHDAGAEVEHAPATPATSDNLQDTGPDTSDDVDTDPQQQEEMEEALKAFEQATRGHDLSGKPRVRQRMRELQEAIERSSKPEPSRSRSRSRSPISHNDDDDDDDDDDDEFEDVKQAGETEEQGGARLAAEQRAKEEERTRLAAVQQAEICAKRLARMDPAGGGGQSRQPGANRRRPMSQLARWKAESHARERQAQAQAQAQAQCSRRVVSSSGIPGGGGGGRTTAQPGGSSSQEDLQRTLASAARRSATERQNKLRNVRRREAGWDV